MSDKYILDDDGNPVPCDDLMIWAVWFEQASRDRSRVLQQDYAEGSDDTVGVSTVFLGLDYNYFGDGPPLLWETLVFGTSLDGTGNRYSTREAALRGHREFLERVREAYAREQRGDNSD